MSYYRQHFPRATVLPKMHILEDHTVTWLRTWGIGAGLMGEQGAESVHAHFANLERVYASIPNPLQRLARIMNEHQLETAPATTTLRPPVKKKPRKATK